MTRVGTILGLVVLLFLSQISSQISAQQRGLTEAQVESAEFEET